MLYEVITINNIAWTLRRLPVFGVFGRGDYRIQPLFVGDLADLAAEHAAQSENTLIDAIGPETFTFRELVVTIGEIVGKRRPIVSVSPRLGYLAASIIGWWVGDVFLVITSYSIHYTKLYDLGAYVVTLVILAMLFRSASVALPSRPR